MIHKTLRRKLNIKQYWTEQNAGMNVGAPEW